MRTILMLLALSSLAGCGSSAAATASRMPPAAMRIVSGDSQVGQAGQELAQPLVVRVEDAQGVPIAGQIVNFRVIEGAGTVFAGVAQTGAEGTAREWWTLGPSTGVQRLEARAVDPITGERLVFAVFEATAAPAHVTVLQATAGSGQEGTIGEPLASPIQIRVVDGAGAGVPGVTTTFHASGTGSATPAELATDASGFAECNWTLGQELGSQLLTVTIPGQAPLELAARAFGTHRFHAANLMITPTRSGHAAVRLLDGKVLIAGGGFGAVALPSEVFDPDTGSFTQVGSMVARRWRPAAALLASGMVLFAGGEEMPGVALSSAELYDPLTGTFAPTGEMSTVRAVAAAATLPDGRVLIAGGGAGGPGLVSAELFDPATGTFHGSADMHEARAGPSATVLADGTVLLVGGIKTGGSDIAANAEVFDPATESFTLVGTMATKRVDHTATLVADGRVLVAGGNDGEVGALRAAEIYDPATRTFSLVQPMAHARLRHAASRIAAGGVLVMGEGTAERFDIQTGAFTDAGPMNYPGSRFDHTATLLLDGRILVAGGVGDPLYGAEIWW